MIGAKIARGWRATIRERVGGTAGCTHLVEMLDAMATVAYQTLYPARQKKEEQGPPGKRGALVDTCYAFRSDGPVVKKEWPEFYTGE
jgi:prenyltransferase beta subunit